jgi:hypothetical protein
VGVVEEPSGVGLTLALDEVHGICNAWIGRKTGVPEVVERTENVVVVAGGECEVQNAGWATSPVERRR